MIVVTGSPTGANAALHDGSCTHAQLCKQCHATHEDLCEKNEGKGEHAPNSLRRWSRRRAASLRASRCRARACSATAARCRRSANETQPNRYVRTKVRCMTSMRTDFGLFLRQQLLIQLAGATSALLRLQHNGRLPPSLCQ